MQVTEKQLQSLYREGLIDPQRLWDNGFRPMSNKYRFAEKSWTYKKKLYNISIILGQSDYKEFKMCGAKAQREEEEREEREEWERIKYLTNKYGGE